MTNTNEMITQDMVVAHLAEKTGVDIGTQEEDLSLDNQDVNQNLTETELQEETTTENQQNTQEQNIKIGAAFNDIIPSENQSQQHFDPSSIDRLVEQKVNETLRNIAQQNNGQQPTQEQQVDIQEVIRREITQAIHAERQAVQGQHVINQYNNFLNEKLKAQGIDLQQDLILKEWSDRKLDDCINFVQNQYQRRLTPNELKEVANFHSEQLEERLNIRKGKTFQQPNQQTVTPIGNATQVAQSNKPATTVDKLTSDYTALAKKQGNELSPSQAIAYQKKLMRLQGQSKVRF